MGNISESVELTRKLVSIESISLEEEEIMRYVHDYFDRRGIPVLLDSFEVEDGDVSKEVYNVEVGDVENSELLIVAHLDTVEFEEDNWKESQPLSGEIKDGKLYGRGSADTKSNAAAAMIAVKNAYEKTGDPNVALLLESDEETGFRGADRFLTKYENEDTAISFTVMCEPKDLDIVTRHKGLYHANITINRSIERTHASKAHIVGEDGEVYQPEETALQAALPVLEELESIAEYMKGLEPDTDLGAVTFATTTVDGGNSNNTLPQKVKIETDSRIPPNQSVDQLVEEVESRLKPLLGDKDTLEFKAVHDPVQVDPDQRLVQKFYESAEKAGAEPELGSMEAFTELGLYHDRLGVPGVIFGTSPNEVIHNPDEYVDIESIVTVRKTFENMIDSMKIR